MTKHLLSFIGKFKNLIIIVLSLCSFTFSQEKDLPQIRAILDYLEVKSLDEVMDQMAGEIRKQLAAGEKALFSAVWDNTNYKSELKSVISNSICKNFTLDEINVLIRYNGTEDGRSVLSKNMSELIPDLLSLDQKSIQSAIEEFKRKTGKSLLQID